MTIKFHPNVVDYLKEIHFYSKPVEKSKLKTFKEH